MFIQRTSIEKVTGYLEVGTIVWLFAMFIKIF